MPKKRIDLPPIDFTSPENEEWVNMQIKSHPEIINDGLYHLSKDDLSRIATGRLSVVSRPGTPKKNGNKIDWDAWFLYYNLCLQAGFLETYESIGQVLDRSPITVKQKFIEIGKSLVMN